MVEVILEDSYDRMFYEEVLEVKVMTALGYLLVAAVLVGLFYLVITRWGEITGWFQRVFGV